MGAIEYSESMVGKTAKEAFNNLVEDATQEYGYDRYNGTISNSRLGNCLGAFPNTAKGMKDLNKFVDNQLEKATTKNFANYVVIENYRYIVKTVKKVKNTNYTNPRVLTKYAVMSGSKQLTVKDTPKEADDAMLKLAFDYGSLTVEKVGVIEKGDNQVSSTSIEMKEYKKKPNLKDAPNRQVYRENYYVFFGLANS